MLPSPVSRHEVGVPSLAIFKLMVWDVIEAINEVRVREDAVDELSGVAVPNLVVSCHPLGCRSIFRGEAMVFSRV